MGIGLAVGGFAQGMSQGLQTGFGIGKARREAERYELEKPKLEADAEEAKSKLAFQQDFNASVKDLMAKAKGGEITNPDGTVTQAPPMDPIDTQLRVAELMKEKMFEHGMMDFNKLKAANDYSKKMKEEGVLEAIRYASANPGDAEGIRKIFNSKGKVKLGDDIQFGVQDGAFGPEVVGYRVGKNGQQQVAFTSLDILLPYMGAESYANMKVRAKELEIREAGADRRAALTAGTNLEAARLRIQADRQNTAAKYAREDQNYKRDRADKNVDMIVKMADNQLSDMLRNSFNQAENNRVTAIMNEVAAAAIYRMRAENSPAKGDPVKAYSEALAEVFKRRGVNTDPLFETKKP